MRNKEIAIFGTSGFSRETLDVCMDNGYEEIVFIGEGRQDKECRGYRVVDEGQIVLLQQNWGRCRGDQGCAQRSTGLRESRQGAQIGLVLSIAV